MAEGGNYKCETEADESEKCAVNDSKGETKSVVYWTKCGSGVYGGGISLH